MTWRIGSNRGLTLIELLVSVTILASAIVLIMQALARGAYALSSAETRTNVYAFSVAKMADLALGLDQGVIPKPSGQFQAGNVPVHWRVDAAPVDGEPELELMTLTVDWSQSGRPYESRVSTVRRVTLEEK